jgi:two-component sensor histidine kinase
MKKYLAIFFMLVIPLFGSVKIDENTTNFYLLPYASLYVDDTNTLLKDEITKKDFQPINKKVLNYGFVDGKTLWIQFTLQNTTNIILQKRFTYQTAEKIVVYDSDNTIIKKDARKTIKPFFSITLQPFETKTFYIQAYSKIHALRAKIVLYNHDDAIDYDYQYKVGYGIFFGILVIMFIYNSLLWRITKDNLYGYYIFYLSTLLIFQLIYLGVMGAMAPAWLFTIITKDIMFFITLLLFSITLFSIKFLNLKRFPFIIKTLKIYFILMVVAVIISYDNWLINLDITLIALPWIFFIIFSSMYSWYHGETQAKFYVFSWFIIMMIFLGVLLRTAGLISVEDELALFYIYAMGFIAEAIIFSLSITYKIEILTKNEKEKLQKIVQWKTDDLQKALSLQTTLYRELNHRIKNTISMIVSLLSLQIRTIKSDSIKEALTHTKNRISALLTLYESLHIKSGFQNEADGVTYFENITQNIQKNFIHHHTIWYDIQYIPQGNSLTYCGLIVNELITNSFKYAFKGDTNGTIVLQLYKQNGIVTLVVKDNGSGYEQKEYKSFGLKIVQSLVEKQLLGTMITKTDDGTSTIIEWREED